MRLFPIVLLAACATNTDEVEALQQEVAELSEALALLQSDETLSDASADIVDLQARMDAVEAADTAAAADRTALSVQVADVQADLVLAQDDVTALSGRLDALEASATDDADALTALTTRVAANETIAAETDTRLQTLEGDTVLLEQNITTLQSTLQVIEGDIEALGDVGGGLEVLGDVVYSDLKGTDWETLDLSASIGERAVIVLLQLDWADDIPDGFFFFHTGSPGTAAPERNSTGVTSARVRTSGVAEVLVLTAADGTVEWAAADPISGVINVTVLAAIP